jgi:hypothetical protein
MKRIIPTLILGFATAFAHETESCWGGPYWDLMEKSQRICNWREGVFQEETGKTCRIRRHNDSNVC